MEYIGEHLLPGQIGHFAIILGFTTSLLAAIAYFFAAQKRNLPEYQSWRRIGRWAFTIHGLSTFTVIYCIFHVMLNKYYEYQYAWAHVNDDLPFHYTFPAFWEGQEGSFLLWSFWHIVLGWILIATAKKWEAPVMSAFSLVQFFIGSMILGVYFGSGESEIHIGSNPLMLLRDVMDAPIFAQADYVEKINGNGLNPLLQNYWMIIHPPVLFLGFASTIVPFCYAIAGMWTGEHKAWLRPVTRWSLFSGAILGLGILMGGAWAYEALSFGGYWAWDPVENMSLVPWILLVAGIHTNLIARSTGYSIRSTYLFYIFTFILVLYSTFLTRSGILGDTSVHAFTEMGLENQLVLFIMTFLLLGLGLFVKRYKTIPAPQKEESTPSKEFWMFIGALVLLFSSILITVSTSLPVYNKIAELFNPAHEALNIKDPVEHHNKYQLWIAVLIGFLSGFAQYLRFREFNWKKYASKFTIHSAAALLIAGVLTYLTTQWIRVGAWQYLLLLFSAFFAVVSNIDYLITFLRGNLKAGGSALSHIGFGLMVVGIVASGLNKRHISHNKFAQQNILDAESLEKNVLLMRGEPLFMNGYLVTYERDTMIGNERIFEVNYDKLDKNGQVEESFQVFPVALYNNEVTKVAAFNPSTKRYLDKDIFTHIANLPSVEADAQARKAREDSLNYQLFEGLIGDTIFTSSSYAVIESVNRQPSHPDYVPQEKDLTIGVKVAFRQVEVDTVWYAEPMLVLRGNLMYNYPAQINELSTKVRVSEKIIERYFPTDEQLDYTGFRFTEGQQVNFNGYQITFDGFDLKPTHPDYETVEGDIVVGAKLSIVSLESGKQYQARPIYLIRNNRPFNLKSQLDELGLHFRFLNIDPNQKTIEINIAQVAPERAKVPIEIADNSFRSDFIVLEAIIFPGINLFWIGTLLMLFGLTLSIFYRRQRKAAAA